MNSCVNYDVYELAEVSRDASLWFMALLIMVMERIAFKVVYELVVYDHY